MGKEESEAAAALGRARWKGVSKKKRTEHASMAASKRHADKTPEERSEASRKAAQARWGKKKK